MSNHFVKAKTTAAEIVSYEWDFWDGTPRTGGEVSKTNDEYENCPMKINIIRGEKF